MHNPKMQYQRNSTINHFFFLPLVQIEAMPFPYTALIFSSEMQESIRYENGLLCIIFLSIQCKNSPNIHILNILLNSSNLTDILGTKYLKISIECRKKITVQSKYLHIALFSFGNPFHSCKKQMCTGYIFMKNTYGCRIHCDKNLDRKSI